jgi:hypothetical protein
MRFHAESASSRAGAARSAKGAKVGLPDSVPHADGHRGRGTEQDTHRSAPLIVLASSEKIQLPTGLAGGDKGGERQGNKIHAELCLARPDLQTLARTCSASWGSITWR